LIGRKSSMLMLLRDYAGGDLMVGNNGYVWISDKSDIPLLLKAIKLIEHKAHKSGLTDEVAAMLRDERGEPPFAGQRGPQSEEMGEGTEGERQESEPEENIHPEKSQEGE
jgi:exosome complex component RRP4